MRDPETRTAAIALGSNLKSQWGDLAANLHEAIKRLGRLGQVRAKSSLYDTAPVGYTNQPRFLNGAILLDTLFAPVELMAEMLKIEREMGRDRSQTLAKGPRVIDLDLLLMDDMMLECVRSPNHPAELTLPHSALAARRFVLEPLAEIAPAMVDPRSGLTIQELLARL
jgi:2-amino-4-hydroxy-6-hydroxymethyldihydropteridine diphosphokinase